MLQIIGNRGTCQRLPCWLLFEVLGRLFLHLKGSGVAAYMCRVRGALHLYAHQKSKWQSCTCGRQRGWYIQCAQYLQTALVTFPWGETVHTVCDRDLWGMLQVSTVAPGLCPSNLVQLSVGFCSLLRLEFGHKLLSKLLISWDQIKLDALWGSRRILGCMPSVSKKQLLPTIENEAISSTVLEPKTFTAATNIQMM